MIHPGGIVEQTVDRNEIFPFRKDIIVTGSRVPLSMVRKRAAHGERTRAPVLLVHGYPDSHRVWDEVCDALTKAAERNDLPVPFFIRLLFQESEFKPDMVSSAGAQGVAQFMPETAADVGLDNPFDPLQAIPASARLLRRLFHRFGNLGLAAAAYNAGPKRIEAWQTKKGTLPQETQGYVKTITGRPAEQWSVAEAGTPAPRFLESMKAMLLAMGVPKNHIAYEGW